jgi:hypothetical protein
VEQDFLHELWRSNETSRLDAKEISSSSMTRIGMHVDQILKENELHYRLYILSDSMKNDKHSMTHTGRVLQFDVYNEFYI